MSKRLSTLRRLGRIGDASDTIQWRCEMLFESAAIKERVAVASATVAEKSSKHPGGSRTVTAPIVTRTPSQPQTSIRDTRPSAITRPAFLMTSSLSCIVLKVIPKSG